MFKIILEDLATHVKVGHGPNASYILRNHDVIVLPLCKRYKHYNVTNYVTHSYGKIVLIVYCSFIYISLYYLPISTGNLIFFTLLI
jgi:hypothetical protein